MLNNAEQVKSFCLLFPNEELPSTDLHHLRHAEGWMELGDLIAASQELDKITSTFHAHPDVLSTRYAIHAKAKNWPMCEQIAKALVALVADHPAGWISLAQAQHFQGRSQDAYNTLNEVLPRFSKIMAISYDFACYAAQIGKIDTAKKYLKKAFDLADDKEKLRQVALEDKDLELLWEEIQRAGG